MEATIQNAASKLMEARCRLIVQDPWYGSMAQRIEWKRDITGRVKTMGVRIIRGGRIQCLWDEKFINSLRVDGLMGVVQHEIEHIVRLHIVRTGSRERDLFNVATDACINGTKNNPRIKELPGNCIYMPENEKGISRDSTAEEVYDWLLKNQPKTKACTGATCEKCDGKGCNKGEHPFAGAVIDDHDIWKDSSMDEAEARQLVRDMVESATKKAGSAPGHLSDAIAELQEPYISWKYLLRRWVGRRAGGRRTTYSRAHRQRQTFGVKGRSTHASVPLTVLTDTSGSITQEALQQFFAEIESMSQGFKITLVQWDVGVTSINSYRRGDWKSISVDGRGGTDFLPVLTQGIEEGWLGTVNIVLTDGYFSWPDVAGLGGFDFLWCITTDVEVPDGLGDKIQLPNI